MKSSVHLIVRGLAAGLAGAAGIAVAVAAPAAGVSQAQVGRVSFATSGTPAGQELFLRGLAQLHNFEYEDAEEDFVAARKLDPGFAMAYWGEAMTKNHPIWMEQDTAAGRAILMRLGPTSAARLAKAHTVREKDYLRAVEVLFGEDAPAGSTAAGEVQAKRRRDLEYADYMAMLHAKYPDDVDAAAFHALAILGTAHEGRDFSIYMRSAAILEEAFPASSNHPGVAHYMIHSYDDPVHAPLGLKAARVYSRIAPAAAHAQHMTSHIFLALGMWDDVIAANETAMQVVNSRRAAKSQPPRACGHYSAWLLYAYLQEGRRDDARRVLDACLDQAATAAAAPAPAVASLSSIATPPVGAPEHACATAQTIDPDRSPAGSAAQMWSRYMLDSGLSPKELDGIAPPLVDHPAARLTLEFTRGLVAAGNGDLPRAREALASVQAARRGLLELLDREGKPEPNDRARAGVLESELRAAILAAENKKDEAVALLRQAAKDEEGLPMAFGPPFVDKPAHELLGEILLEMGRPDEARAAFQTAVSLAPNRARSIAGLRGCSKAGPGSPGITER